MMQMQSVVDTAKSAEQSAVLELRQFRVRSDKERKELQDAAAAQQIEMQVF